MNRNHFVDFFRTLSYRESLTSFSLAIFIISLKYIRNFYYYVDFIESTNNWAFNSFFFALIMILNHIFYRIEHKRHNVFYVRIFIDVIFILIYVVLRNIFLTNYAISIGDIFIALIYVFLIESVFSIIKIGLSYIK